ncbi:MAG: WYL domain-containing protein [Chloroflexi bacterium]|nr:WYL domain-containing protein [Chloroflexota bacterium]
MTMDRGLAKAERLREMERMYFLRAYSDQEMAVHFDIDRTTIYRNRTELEKEVPFVKDDRGRWKIDKMRYLSAIRVNINEALVLYLAARRMSQQTCLAQRHVVSALESLALALKQPMTEKLVKAAQAILNQRANPEKTKILETITQGWVEGLKVRIRYRGLQAKHAYTHLVSPYLIEPSPWSDSIYLIAYSDVFEDITTFKIERIEKAMLGMSSDTFTIPDNFDEQKLLKHAWGIWRREGEPEIVKLKFAPGNATRRLKESIWHPLETVTDTEDGGCTWEAPIAEWREMLPWVRGWGSSVIVEEPQELQETMMGETKAMAETYGWFVASQSSEKSSTLDDFYGG